LKNSTSQDTFNTTIGFVVGSKRVRVIHVTNKTYPQ
jgi:hypothetical protein